MAICSSCGRDYGFFNGTHGRCYGCINAGTAAEFTAAASEKAAAQSAHQEMKQRAQSVLLTTEQFPSGLTIADRLGIVTAECVFGMHMFKDLFAVGRDIFGGRSDAIQNTMKDARNTALDELRIEAAKLGANAVIAVDLDYSEISGGGKSMLFLVASGTAVRVQ